MEEPKRRMRRRAQPEGQPGVSAEPVMEENAPPRRRRIQPPAQAQQETDGNSEKQQPKTEQHTKAGFGRRGMQAVLGMAALLAMAGAAVIRAAKRIGAACGRLRGRRKPKPSAKMQISKAECCRLAAMALCTCVAVVSAWQVGSIVLRSIRTRQLNASLSRQRQAMMAQQSEMQEQPDEMAAAFSAETEPQAVPEPQAEPEPKAAATAAPGVVRTTKYRQVGGDALPEMAQLHQQNHDLVAWMQIPDVLDLPVVYRDNSYYLTRDFTRQKNVSGAIFLDENHPFREKTQNLLLHGHNMKDGTMFGRLTQYLSDDSYLRNHPFIYFDTLWHKEQYIIFAVLNVSLKPGDTRFFNYFTHDTFASDAEFAMYIRQLQLRSAYAIPIDVEPADALLTLSTCLNDDRLVIVARRLREGETRSQLRTLIRMATSQ